MGNKLDRDDLRKVDNAWGKSMADELGAVYMETSAKCNINVKELFRKAADLILAPGERPVPKETYVTLQEKKPETGECMC